MFSEKQRAINDRPYILFGYIAEKMTSYKT